MPTLAGEKIVEDCLAPFRALGLALEPRGAQASADCPFCHRDGKLAIQSDTGLWRCLVCGAGLDGKNGGNALEFARLVWQRSDAATTDSDYRELASDRRLLDYQTVEAWGCCKSIVNQRWLVPGYSVSGRLDQLYRRIKIKDSKGEWVWRLMPLPGLWPSGSSHALHMASMSYDPGRSHINIFEGPWDGMAFWEVARQCKRSPADRNRLELTGNSAASLAVEETIVAVPGCNSWRPQWNEMCRGKHVTLWFDNDHPRQLAGGSFSCAGYDGSVRVARELAKVAASVRWCRWPLLAGATYEPTLPDGFDVRDALCEVNAI